MSETAEKLISLRRYMQERHYDGVVLSTRANFAWLTGGGDNHVVSQMEGGIAALVVTQHDAYVVANTIEMNRLIAEEPLTAFIPYEFRWTRSLAEVLADLLGNKKIISDDVGQTRFLPLPTDFVWTLRASLTTAEQQRYHALGRDCSQVMEKVAQQINPGDTEHAIEAALAQELLRRGIQPFLLLIGCDERLDHYRHPTPTAHRLRKTALLVVCGQRGGQIANLSRVVHFGPLSAELQAKHQACCQVEAALWEATVPGKTWGEALNAGIAAYQTFGFAADWQRHHQGGPTGYAGRDLIVTPTSRELILDRQAVSWNPSISGTKSEDTFILNGNEKKVITACSANWPTITVQTPSGQSLVRPAILVRS
jgi:Xaa-Pro dipeptidase